MNESKTPRYEAICLGLDGEDDSEKACNYVLSQYKLLETELRAAQQRIASIEKQLPDQWTIEEMHADWESKEKQNTKLDVEIHVLQQTILQQAGQIQVVKAILDEHLPCCHEPDEYTNGCVKHCSACAIVKALAAFNREKGDI